MYSGDIPPTKPAHGVIATRPATSPDAAPSVVACPVRSRSTTSQPSIPAAAAMCVFTSAWRGEAVRAERGTGVEAEPPEPEDAGADERQRQRMCGGIGCCGQPASLAEHEHRGERGDPGVDVHDRATGEVERTRRNSQPAGENTQCATGAYTRIAHSPRNQHPGRPNRMRSAIAPVISAGVITANIIWYATERERRDREASEARRCRPSPRRAASEVEVADEVARAAERERVHDRRPRAR